MEKIVENNNIEEIKNTKGRVLVDFYAEWCGPCKMLGPVLTDISEEIDVYKIDVDKNADLASNYNVYSIPTVVLFNNGEEEDRFVGLKSKNEILEFIK